MENAIYGGNEPNINVKTELFEDEDVKPCISRKRERSFGSDTFSEAEERDIRQKLDIGLSRNETMQRPGPGGCRLTYIEGWKVIHDANQIFGFNGWSSQIMQLDLRYVDENHGRFNACVSACVRITLRDGAYREDRGGGTADNMRSKGDAILKAEKEAVTDATKRALKNFGLRLGLSLYDRQHVRDMNKPQAREPNQQMHAGMQTPVPNRSAPGGSVRVPTKTSGSSPVTPGVPSRPNVSNTTGHSPGSAMMQTSNDNQIAAKREQAIQRQQAFRRAKAAQDKGNNSNMVTSNSRRAQNGVSMGNVSVVGQKNLTHGMSAGSPPATSHGYGASVSNANSRPNSGAAPSASVVGRHGNDAITGRAGSGTDSVRQGRSGTIDYDVHRRGHGVSRGSGGVTGQASDVPPNALGNSARGRMVHDSTDAGSATIRQREIDELSRMALADF